MKFTKLTINGWKQFFDIDIDFHDKLTILTGANGSGKTTLLNLLAKHFGWSFSELSTPVKDISSGEIKWLNKIIDRETENTSNKIGEIQYDNETKAQLMLSNVNNSHQYTIEIKPKNNVNGLNIVSHRDTFRYKQISQIPTKSRTRIEAFSIVHNYNKKYYTEDSPFRKNINYSIKETLLSWAVSSIDNEFFVADQEAKKNFEKFQNILSILLPQSLGFDKITIRNYEIVFVTTSGEFMIDAVSGGIASIIDLAWQIYNYSDKNEPFIVLIDEIESHLHPTMQRNILPNLLQAFPYVQFIVSTHSPLVVGSVKHSNVYAFRYNDQNRVFSQPLDLINKAKTATEILNEVLGIPFTMPIWTEKILEELVRKYRSMELTEENMNRMREEFILEGLESLMPIAINGILKND